MRLVFYTFSILFLADFFPDLLRTFLINYVHSVYVSFHAVSHLSTDQPAFDK